MAGQSGCSVYIGNLDERVSERVLYDILIQVGRVVDLYIPRDKETDKPRGYAFAEYESEDVAEYAVKLFTGLVTLYNRTLKFAVQGQDKPSPNLFTTAPSSHHKLGPSPRSTNGNEVSQHTMKLSTPLTASHGVIHQHNGYATRLDGYNHTYGQRAFGATSGTTERYVSRRYDTSNHISYPSY